MSSVSESNSDDTHTTDDESNTGVSPLPFALTNEKHDTTEAVSAQQCTTRERLNHGRDQFLPESLDSDGELADDEGDISGFSNPESEGRDNGENQCRDDSEDEDDDSIEDIPWYPSTYVPAPGFPRQPPLLPVSMHEIEYAGDKLADDKTETDSEPWSSNVESGEDVNEAEEEEETDALISRSSSVHPDVPLPRAPPTVVAFYRYMDYTHGLQEVFNEGDGEVCGEVDAVRGKKRGSGDDDEDDERARKVQRRI